MQKFKWSTLALILCCSLFGISQSQAADPALTIYNQNFAVVRDLMPLNLNRGTNTVEVTDTTAYLEPDSVILRDPAGKHTFRILEQNYRADPVSMGLLLSLNEGKTIDFLIQRGGKEEIIRGKIIRSGYIAPNTMRNYNLSRVRYPGGLPNQPIIEVDGKLRFTLPGTPLFPSLADGTILKPTLHWLIESDRAAKTQAEFSYITGGISWKADYNVVVLEGGDELELVGWVTLQNESGKTFENAKIKLMAGEVSKIQPVGGAYDAMKSARSMAAVGGSRPVTEKAFDEYHLYELHRPTTLHDRQTKQVEFLRAAGVKSQQFYIYDGVKLDAQRYRGWNIDNIRQNREYGTQSNPKVWVMREFENSEKNRLGMPLPAGRLRFYRRDDDGQLEFTGENNITHTPQGETVRVYTGTSFDLVGERKRTEFWIDTSRRRLDETFEIKLRNRKKEPVEIRVLEHLYRGTNWTIRDETDEYKKIDSQTIEFRISVAPDEEKILTYTAHYSW